MIWNPIQYIIFWICFIIKILHQTFQDFYVEHPEVLHWQPLKESWSDNEIYFRSTAQYCSTGTRFSVTVTLIVHSASRIQVSAGWFHRLCPTLHWLDNLFMCRGHRFWPGGVLMSATSIPVASLALLSSARSDSYSQAASTALKPADAAA